MASVSVERMELCCSNEAGMRLCSSTRMPMPPSHCENDRQNRMERGSPLTFVRIVAPVVVYDEIDSNRAEMGECVTPVSR